MLPNWWNSSKPWIIQDCIEGMRSLPEASVDLIVADPPYFRVEEIEDAEWDHQWKTLDMFLKWFEEVVREFERILKPSGACYVFADDYNVAYQQIVMDRYMTYLNHLIWFKPNNRQVKYACNMRRFAVMSERILFYSQGEASKWDETRLQMIYSDANCFRSIKSYMREERQKFMEKNGLKTLAEFATEIRKITNTSSVVDRHYFADSQFCFPTPEHYKSLQSTGFWGREYEELRREYEELRRPWNYSEGLFEVITQNIISTEENTDHPTTKPVDLIMKLIKVASREGAIVLDPFLGSGTTLKACRLTGRVGIGFEKDAQYEPIIKTRSMENETRLTKWF